MSSTAIFAAMVTAAQNSTESQIVAARPKSIPAPTVMKNSPSSSPLNGLMSLSSSCRYSLVASTTPAMKAPSAGDRPTSDISSAIPITTSNAAAVNSSRRLARAM